MLGNNDKEIAKMEMETGYITYRTLADKVGDMVLCNNIQNRLYESLELVNGYNYDEDDMYDVEIFQWYYNVPYRVDTTRQRDYKI